MPVATVVTVVADGLMTDEIMAEHPGLTPEDIREALLYAAEAAREGQLPLRHPRGWSEFRLNKSILLTMTIAATLVPLSEAKAHLSELARRVRQQHERITLTRNGEPEAVLLSVDDLEGLEMTLEILGDSDAVARISESLTALGRGEQGADMSTVREDLARRRVTGA